MTIVPITLKAARRFVADHHRHNVPPVGWRFGVGLEHAGALVGVAVAGTPVSRLLDDGRTVEVTRVCTLGHKNASTMLYGALCRAAKALGYTRVVTYTLETESGLSLRAAGFAEVSRGPGGRSWASKPNGGRYEATLWGRRLIPTEGRIRWERRIA